MLRFIDHRALAALDRFARGRTLDVVMHTNSIAALRLVEILDLTAVQFELVA